MVIERPNRGGGAVKAGAASQFGMGANKYRSCTRNDGERANAVGI